MDAQIEKLLILQDRDIKRMEVERELERIPLEIQKLEQAIARHSEQQKAAEQALKALEVRRKDLDGEVKTAEEKVVKYKNQQLAVKKNDEYQALTHEIGTMEARIGELEEAEIGLMLEIDEETQKLKATRSEVTDSISAIEKEISVLREREANYRSERDDVVATAEAAEAEVSGVYVLAYRKAQNRKVRPPFVVEIDEQRCDGCHLKVSGETVGAARHWREQPQPVHCDSCGRVVYWPR